MAEKNKKPQTVQKTTALQFIRTIYLSFAAIIGLITFVIGATGAVRLGLNNFLPVDESYSYYSPYSSPCATKWVDGKETKPSVEELKDCEKKNEENLKISARNNFNRELRDSIAMTLVGFPVWLLHFWLIQMDWKRRKEV
jgi:hypothetical protein